MIEVYKQKVLNLYRINYEEALSLSNAVDKEALYKAADEIRNHFCGSIFELCSITSAKSGKCPQDCKWCAQSLHNNARIEEYELIDRNSAVREAVENAKQGVGRHSLVTSGKQVNNKTLDSLVSIYKEIRKESNISLCASMGLVNKRQLLRLKEEAGIEYYHCNLETAPSCFSHFVSSHSIDEKISTIKSVQEAGLKVCSGGIIGMGETMEHRIELALTLRTPGVLSIPINILNPIRGTSLENARPLSQTEILTAIALFRFINPQANIRFAGGRLQIKAIQEKALHAGINAAITGNFLTSQGAKIRDDIEDFTNAGFKLSYGYK